MSSVDPNQSSVLLVKAYDSLPEGKGILNSIDSTMGEPISSTKREAIRTFFEKVGNFYDTVNHKANEAFNEHHRKTYSESLEKSPFMLIEMARLIEKDPDIEKTHQLPKSFIEVSKKVTAALKNLDSVLSNKQSTVQEMSDATDKLAKDLVPFMDEFEIVSRNRNRGFQLEEEV